MARWHIETRARRGKRTQTSPKDSRWKRRPSDGSGPLTKATVSKNANAKKSHLPHFMVPGILHARQSSWVYLVTFPHA